MNVLQAVEEAYRAYEGEKGYIGFSENGAGIPYFLIGRGAPVVLAQFSMHAREYITSYLALHYLDDLVKSPVKGSVYLLPLMNPDGVKICLSGHPLYKANARGVDLNVNFDAKWGTGASNVFTPGAENYVGPYPFSESETRALRDFTYAVRPDATLSFHAKGEEIYWCFDQSGERLLRDLLIAEAVSRETGYPLKRTPNSAGGYKDWCVSALRIPALTIEVGKDALAHPIGREHSEQIYADIKGAFRALAEEL